MVNMQNKYWKAGHRLKNYMSHHYIDPDSLLGGNQVQIYIQQNTYKSILT